METLVVALVAMKKLVKVKHWRALYAERVHLLLQVLKIVQCVQPDIVPLLVVQSVQNVRVVNIPCQVQKHVFHVMLEPMHQRKE